MLSPIPKCMFVSPRMNTSTVTVTDVRAPPARLSVALRGEMSYETGGVERAPETFSHRQRRMLQGQSRGGRKHCKGSVEASAIFCCRLSSAESALQQQQRPAPGAHLRSWAPPILSTHCTSGGGCGAVPALKAVRQTARYRSNGVKVAGPACGAWR